MHGIVMHEMGHVFGLDNDEHEPPVPVGTTCGDAMSDGVKPVPS
jgi:hypothetical protein